MFRFRLPVLLLALTVNLIAACGDDDDDTSDDTTDAGDTSGTTTGTTETGGTTTTTGDDGDTTDTTGTMGDTTETTDTSVVTDTTGTTGDDTTGTTGTTGDDTTGGTTDDTTGDETSETTGDETTETTGISADPVDADGLRLAFGMIYTEMGGAALSPDDKYFAYGSGTRVLVVDVKTGVPDEQPHGQHWRRGLLAGRSACRDRQRRQDDQDLGLPHRD